MNIITCVLIDLFFLHFCKDGIPLHSPDWLQTQNLPASAPTASPPVGGRCRASRVLNARQVFRLLYPRAIAFLYFLIVYLFSVCVLLLAQVSLYSLGWAGIHSVAQVALTLTASLLSC